MIKMSNLIIMNNLFNDDKIKQDKVLSHIFKSTIDGKSPFADSNTEPSFIFHYPIYLDDSISDQVNIDLLPTYIYFCDLTELAQQYNLTLTSSNPHNHYMFYGLHYNQPDKHSYVQFGLLDCDPNVQMEIHNLSNIISINSYSADIVPDIIVDIISNHQVTNPLHIPAFDIGAMINQWGEYYTNRQFGFIYLSFLALSVLTKLRDGLSNRGNPIIDTFLSHFESRLNKNAVEMDTDVWFDQNTIATSRKDSLSIFKNIDNLNLFIHALCVFIDVKLKTKTKSNWEVYSQTTPLIKSISDITSNTSYSLNDLTRFALAENIINISLMFLHDTLIAPSVDTFTYFDQFTRAVDDICDVILANNNTYYNSMTSPVVIDGALELDKLLHAFKHYILFEFDKQDISVNIDDIESMNIDSNSSVPIALVWPSDALFMGKDNHDD